MRQLHERSFDSEQGQCYEIGYYIGWVSYDRVYVCIYIHIFTYIKI